ncbi:hypothetical protein H310_13149 [Aphanomyces invadans]|uniref:K Homology domain-containing protein n=1 Tax=Aphanomyces invadans TaxID=157072 RepID=A0A024TH82_9STRA|nr:hypothetical protein H310_13149 [Aphanomyces invadans]ETV92722.1 hypothetical protein H310_13149 [Aphanomyces invadans]|eukprot:XP_008878758.1 hypothetical protein H310_13149 [Aphanomyces invadans]
MADNDPVARARAIAARLSAVVPDMSTHGKRKWDGDHGPGSMGKKLKKVYIPVEKYPDINFMGLLIGPRGSNQKRMETLSGSKILIRGRGSSKEPSGDADEDEDLHVLITADTDEQIARAQREVEDILFNPEQAMKLKQEQLRQVAENNNQQDGGGGGHYGPGGGSGTYGGQYGGGYGGGSGSGYGDDNTTLNIPVPKSLVGLIIGKGGETIRELQGKSGCHIQVARENEVNPDLTERTVMCSGTPAQVEIAKQLITDLLGDRLHGGSGHSGETMKLSVPNDKVGLIIGRQGSTVKGVQQRSGASIVIPPAPDTENPGLRTLMITGSHDAREKARQEIQLLVSDQHSLVPAGTNVIYMQIPNDRVGIVIGRGGSTIKAVQDRNNVRVQIPNVVDPGSMPEVRTITISASNMESIAMAKAEIDAILLGDEGSGGGRNSRYSNHSSHYGSQSSHYGGGGYDQQYQSYQQQYQQQYAQAYPQYTYEQYQAYYQQSGMTAEAAAAAAASATGAAAPAAATQAATPAAAAATTPAAGATTAATTAAASTTAAADSNDPNAYWNGYYEYAAYYGVDAANAAWGVTAAAEGAAAPATSIEADSSKDNEASAEAPAPSS